MYVCICHAVTDRAIREAAELGVSTLDDLTRHTGCAGSCGSCSSLAEEILAQALPSTSRPFALQFAAAA